MKAKYQSWCAICDGPGTRSIEVGDEIKLVRYEGKERWVHAKHEWQPGKGMGKVPIGKKPITVWNGRVYHRARHENSYNAVTYTLCGKLGRVRHEPVEKLQMKLCATCAKRAGDGK